MLVRIMILVFILDSIALLYLFKIFPFESNLSYAESVTLRVRSIPATEQYINDLRKVGLSPNLGNTVERKPLTVNGSTVTSNGDSIQIFEYTNHKNASDESVLLLNKYSKTSKSSTWEKSIHIYVKDTLIVFYLGENKLILSSLRKTAGSPILGQL